MPECIREIGQVFLFLEFRRTWPMGYLEPPI